MEKVRATLKNVRMSPLKMRVLSDGAHKRNAIELRDELARSQKKAARFILKTLNSAIANAVNNHGMRESDLIIDELQITEGPRRKKASFRARGRMNLELTRYSHVMVWLTDGKEEAPEVEIVEEKKEEKAEEKKADVKDTKKKETKAKETKKVEKKAKKETKKD